MDSTSCSLLFFITFSNQSNTRMKNKRVEAQKLAYKFTNPTVMKFQPQEDFEQPQEEAKKSLAHRIRTFFSPPSKPKIRSPMRRTNSIAISDFRVSSRKYASRKGTLKYIKRLTNQHVLIGNQDQLDAMCVGGIIHDFVDTEYMWSLNIRRAILHVTIDYKKSYIILLPDREVLVYRFDAKAINQKPIFESSITLNKDVRFVQVIKEGFFILCYATQIEVFSIEEGKGIRMTLNKKYDLPKENNLKLYQIPLPYDNILNIFFQEDFEQSASLSLWNIQVEFLEKEVKMSKALKIYEVPMHLKKYLRLQNYSKDIYFINLGQQIYAVRKGYIIDSANVNIKTGHNYLKYISNQKLILVSAIKVEVYNFTVDTTLNPPHIILSSTDSIQIPKMKDNFDYLDAIEMLGQNFAVFYQIKESQNRLINGQIKYCFIITHLIKMQDKIKNILPGQIKNQSIESIQEKADMIKKMGLQTKDIYLRLWNNSDRTEVEDYRILLDTLDYDTIKLEIEKKLKKNSMNFRQVLLLQQGCLSMLSENIFGANNTKQDLKNYFISHLLIRKLQLYKQITLLQRKEDDSSQLMINIQNYNYYKTVDIRAMLSELITRFCNQESVDINKIRIIIKFFKFPLRMMYQEWLTEIIVNTKKKFIKIIQAMPQILPYQHTFISELQIEDPSIYQGIWKQITPQEWQHHLYLDTVSTIDNRQNLAEVCSNVWYKRYWLTQHQFINNSRREIQQMHIKNRSDSMFYLAIEKVFEQVKDYASLRLIIDFIQDHYEKMPQHIYGKIFLYRKLFEHFKENQKISKIQENIDSFGQFLKLIDEDIFKAMFNFQKVKKGFILKQMKPLYMKLAGPQIFNEGLLNYFASDKSQISDIKYLLNRMNNQKKQFHQENEGIYEVLVRGMQLKLKLGSADDIPIDQVLIYIQNIPLSPNNPIMKDLDIMRLINQESQRFRKIKLNMSIFDMTKNVDSVIAAMVLYEIDQFQLLKFRNLEQIKNLAYIIINDIIDVKNKIFAKSEQNQLILFVFLTKLLQQMQLISTVAFLIQDDWINSHFTINQIMIQNLVLYMYKWRMNSSPSYIESTPYLRQLVSLLPPGNQCRQYVQAQIEVANILSTPDRHVLYPLSNGHQYFAALELQNLINHIDGRHLLKINIQKLHQYVVKVQQISSDGVLSEITLHSIYEMVILRLIECDMLKEVVQKIKNLIQIQGDIPYNFIYPSLLVAKIAPQMIQENKNLLMECSAFLFRQPIKLLNLLNDLMNLKATSGQFKAILMKCYESVRHQNSTFSQTSPILQPLYLKVIQTVQQKKNYMFFLKQCLVNLLSHKQQFSRNPEYYIIYVILCNDPYVLIKYLYINKYAINIKDFRCFISYLIKEDIFNKYMTLQFGKRLFFAIYQTVSKNKNIQQVIEEFRNIPLSITRDVQRIQQTKSQFQAKISKSLDRFRLKIKALSNDRERRRIKGLIESDEAKLLKFKQRLQNSVIKEGFDEYPFPDSDDNPKTKEQKIKKEERKDMLIVEAFDPKFERASLMGRTVKALGLYVSIEKQKFQKSIYYSQKFANDGIFGSLTIDKNIGAMFSKGLQNAFGNNGASDGQIKRKLRIGRAQSHYVNLAADSSDLDNLMTKRSKAISNISQQQLNEIKKMEEQVISQVKIPQIGNIFAQTTIIKKILNENQQITQNSIFDFSHLEPYKNHQQFLPFLKQLVTIVFGNQNLSFKDILIFVKKLVQAYPILIINKQWIQIYMRADALQNKFSLALPLKQILTADGLFVDSQISDTLFAYLLPAIITHLNEQNILKICKVITLAFKKTDLEQEILFSYLLELCRNYQRTIFNPSVVQKQLKMYKQKISMIVNKIHIKLLVGRDDQIMCLFQEDDIRREMGQLISASFKKRYDIKSSDYFVEKWVKRGKVGKLQT